MRAEILTRDELTREDIEALWAQGVCMDDWDYIILAPAESLRERRYEDIEYNYKLSTYEKVEKISYTQTEWTFDRMLVGVCSNEWYLAKVRDKLFAVGIAYHS